MSWNLLEYRGLDELLFQSPKEELIILCKLEHIVSTNLVSIMNNVPLKIRTIDVYNEFIEDFKKEYPNHPIQFA